MDSELASSNGAYYTGNIIYLSTFSKTLAPGLRIAWIVAPPEVISKLVQIKQGVDLHTSTFNQMVIYEVAKDGFIDEHVQQLREVYRKRRDVMLAAMDRYMPPEVEWTHPEGGLFLWATFPRRRSTFRRCLKKRSGVTWRLCPARAFYTIPNPPPTARLNFSCMNEDQIVEGIRRLSDATKQVLHAADPIATP